MWKFQNDVGKNALCNLFSINICVISRLWSVIWALPSPEDIKHFSCYKTFFMLNSAEHEIFRANKYENTNISWHFHIYWHRKFHAQLCLEFASLSNLRFISRTKFMLSWVEHEKDFITSGPGHLLDFIRQSELRIIFACYSRLRWLYSWLSLSRPLLSRITAYLEVEIWSLPKHENLTTGEKILWKRGEIAPQYFQYISAFESNYTYICSMWLFELFFPNSANLICRGMDISKYFREP